METMQDSFNNMIQTAERKLLAAVLLRAVQDYLEYLKTIKTLEKTANFKGSHEEQLDFVLLEKIKRRFEEVSNYFEREDVSYITSFSSICYLLDFDKVQIRNFLVVQKAA